MGGGGTQETSQATKTWARARWALPGSASQTRSPRPAPFLPEGALGLGGRREGPGSAAHSDLGGSQRVLWEGQVGPFSGSSAPGLGPSDSLRAPCTPLAHWGLGLKPGPWALQPLGAQLAQV